MHHKLSYIIDRKHKDNVETIITVGINKLTRGKRRERLRIVTLEQNRNFFPCTEPKCLRALSRSADEPYVQSYIIVPIYL